MIWNGIQRPLAGWALAAWLALSSKPDPATLLSKPSPSEGWTSLDFKTATCGYVAPISMTFSVPPAYVVRNPHHGTEMGCFWGRQEDLDRAFVSARHVSFESLGHGIFEIRRTENVGYDAASGKFTAEDEVQPVLEDAGVTGSKVARLTLGGHPALVITGRRPDGLDLYMLYVAEGKDADVVLINYRPATPPTPADSSTWQLFLEAIR
jgi:hypothetical protein